MKSATAALLAPKLTEIALAVEETITTPGPCLDYGRAADVAAIFTFIVTFVHPI